MAKQRYWPQALYLGTGAEPDDREVWVFAPVDDPPDWIASYRVIEQDGELVVAEMRMGPTPESDDEGRWFTADHARIEPRHPKTYTEPGVPQGGLSTRKARAALRIGEGLALARDEGFVAAEVARKSKFRPLFGDRALAQSPGRVGRRGRPDRYYAELAAAYVATVEAGSQRPVAAVADQLGAGYTPAYVRDALHRARQRDLLTHPPRGRAGGRLTDKAHAALTDPA